MSAELQAFKLRGSAKKSLLLLVGHEVRIEEQEKDVLMPTFKRATAYNTDINTDPIVGNDGCNRLDRRRQLLSYHALQCPVFTQGTHSAIDNVVCIVDNVV